MSIIGMCGFNGLSAGYDDLTVSLGAVAYDTVVPNVNTTSSVLPVVTSLAGGIPWQGAATGEFWLHGHILRGINDANNGLNRVGWASSGTVLGWASMEPLTLAWTIAVNGAVLTTSASTAGIGTWHSLAVHVKLDAAAGFVRVYADGDLATPVASYTGNTDPTGATTANQFYLRLHGGTTSRLANLVAMDPLDGAGIVDKNSLLDVGIKGLAPAADGTYSAWTPDTGVVGYTQIDEAPPDDATYVQASAVGQRSTYGMTTSGVATVVAAKWCSRIRRPSTTAGTQVQITRRLAATDYDETAVAAPAEGYVFDVWDQKPGGGAWTATDLDATQFGVVSAT